MKKSMLNVITLALVLINLVLTVLLTFSLVSTNNRTNNLIKKVGEIIDLDAAGNAANGSQTGSAVNIDDIEYVDCCFLWQCYSFDNAIYCFHTFG